MINWARAGCRGADVATAGDKWIRNYDWPGAGVLPGNPGATPGAEAAVASTWDLKETSVQSKAWGWEHQKFHREHAPPGDRGRCLGSEIDWWLLRPTALSASNHPGAVLY